MVDVHFFLPPSFNEAESIASSLYSVLALSFNEIETATSLLFVCFFFFFLPP
jgi:hypothetical protein